MAIDLARLGPPAGARCLVTGGCGGIGRAYVAGLLANGCRVAVVDLAASLAAHPVPEGVVGIAADARDDAATARAVEEAAEALGGLDVFAFITGMNAAVQPIEAMAMAAIREVLEINLLSAFAATRAALPHLRKSGAGAAVYVASGLHAFVEPGFSAYSASKGGLVSLMKVVAREGAPGVRANAVAPGAVETAFLSGGLSRGGTESGPGGIVRQFGEEGARKMIATIPLGRIAQPEDVAAPMLFLSGPASQFMTGQVLYVNGGRFAP